MEISFVKFDPRAPLVGLRANTGAWFETETSSSQSSNLNVAEGATTSSGYYERNEQPTSS
jgi:hypothetical protein